MNKVIKIQSYFSPCGEMLLGSYEGKLCLCDWQKGKRHHLVNKRLCEGLQANIETGESDVINEAINRLNEYFASKRTQFNMPLLFVGTDFQKSVWNELLKIPFGVTWSYAELSRRINNPKAVRAVANANGANAISIFVPCHRVIGSNNLLTGYGGGLAAKEFLLNLEKKIVSV
ncbi:MAG: methylated-DNA--[protein]-cysteine S-methyltransferase [Bacteroidales bacterium]|jgi:methylated-DNA-[protein]-cysteine S-methyltransferase|nr:methylated-DNA--[protein]-cysteine S-methyltransferase [Bacteroidales bacterium]